MTFALDAIKASKPDTSILADLYQKKVVQEIVNADEGLKKKIDDGLKKYDSEHPDSTLLTILQDNLKELAKDFEDLNTLTGIELKTLTDGLAAVANSDKTEEPSTPAKAKKAAKLAAKKLFNGVGDAIDKLDGLADKSKEAFIQSFSSKHQQK